MSRRSMVASAHRCNRRPVDRLLRVIPSFSRVSLHVVALVVVIALAGCSADSDGGGAGSPAAATVNGEQITPAELQQSVPLFEFLASLSQAPCGQPDPASGES